MRSLLLTLALVAPALAVPSITVGPRAEVSSPTVRLGDVAKIRGFAKDAAARFAAIELGRAPTVGTGKLLPKAFLKTRIRGAGVPPGVRLKLPRRLEVTRKARTVRGSELRARVTAAIRDKMPHADADVAELMVPKLPDLRVPAGAELDVTFAKGERFDGPGITATLEVSDAGKRVQTRRVSARLDIYRQAWGVDTAARRGRNIDAAELVPLRLAASKVPPDAIRTADEAARAKLRRAVRVGEPIRRAWLEVPPMVRRGDRVRMVARRGLVELTAAGEALADARHGDTVRVRNLASRKVVSGRVDSANLVVMEF